MARMFQLSDCRGLAWPFWPLAASFLPPLQDVAPVGLVARLTGRGWDALGRLHRVQSADGPLLGTSWLSAGGLTVRWRGAPISQAAL